MLSRRGFLGSGIAAAAVGMAASHPSTRLVRLGSNLVSLVEQPAMAAVDSPLKKTVGGYFTSDGYRHAIVASSTSRLQEVFFNPNRPTGVSQLASFDVVFAIDSFVSTDDGVFGGGTRQHQIVATRDGTVEDISFRPGDITGRRLARFDVGVTDVAGFFSADDSFCHAIVLDADGSIFELYYQKLGLTTFLVPNQIFGVSTALLLPASALSRSIFNIAAFYTPDDRRRHVILATDDGQVTEYAYGAGLQPKLTVLGEYGPLIDVAGFFTPDDGLRHAVLARADGRLTELYYRQPNAISVAELTNLPGVTAIAGFYTPDDRRRHVIAARSEGQVTEVFFKSSVAGVGVATVHRFRPPVPRLEDVSPDPRDLDGVLEPRNSPAGRMVGIAGTGATYYATHSRSGVWKLSRGVWAQLENLPAPGPPYEQFGKVAVNQHNSRHLVVFGPFGATESFDGGGRWTPLAFDATTFGAATKEIFSAVFTPNGRLLLGSANGIAMRRTVPGPFGGSFKFKPLVSGDSEVTGFACNGRTVWARTAKNLYASTNNGANFGSPVAIPPSAVGGSRSVGGDDRFAYLPYIQNNGGGGKDVLGVWIYDSSGGPTPWQSQTVRVTLNGVPNSTLNGGFTGHPVILRSFLLNDPLLARRIGVGIQMFLGDGECLVQAGGRNPDGTISSWNLLGLAFAAYGGPTTVHEDWYDFCIDQDQFGGTLFLTTDGGVSRTSVTQSPLSYPYKFSTEPLAWDTVIAGLHTNIPVALSIIPTTPERRSIIAYANGDDDGWARDTSPIVASAAHWQLISISGDSYFSWSDAGVPFHVLQGRSIRALRLHTITTPHDPTRGSYAIVNSSAEHPWESFRSNFFHFIQTPKGEGQGRLDAVVMAEIPLLALDSHGNPDPNAPFKAPGDPSGLGNAAASGWPPDVGNPVLIRNRNFALQPDINLSKGDGWTVEIDRMPRGALGFYVTGTSAAPAYYCYAPGITEDAQGNTAALALFRWFGGIWQELTQIPGGVVEGVSGDGANSWFGPAFVNPFNPNIVYAIGNDAIYRSLNAAAQTPTYTQDVELTQLVLQGGTQPTKSLAHIAFDFDNPRRAAAVTNWGAVFFGPTRTGWSDLTSLLPTPLTPGTVAGIDSEAVYVATFGRSVVRIVNYTAV